MQHAIDFTDYPHPFQQASICEGFPELLQSPGDGSAGEEGGNRASEDDPSGRNGLLGKLQRNFSSSLSRISGIVPGPNASRRRRSSVGVDVIAAVAEAGKEGCSAEASSPALDALMPFVPLMFRRDLLLPEPTFSAMEEPCVQTHQGAVMIADITGFTALTEDLGRQGAAGVELLTSCMNNFFTLVIDLVYSHGGDVMRFAGDSVICAFLPTAEEADSEDKGLATATQRAVRCAAVLANDLGSMRMLMDGRLVALPEEERRLMRAAAAAAKSAERDLQLDAQRGSAGTARARRMHRATIDSQTPSPTRGAPRVSAWPRPRKANSLDLPARDRMLIQQSESRSTIQDDDAALDTTEPEPVTALHPHPAALSQSFLHRLSGMRSSSAGLTSIAHRVSSGSKSLGNLLSSLSRTQSEDEAEMPDRVKSAGDAPPRLVKPRRATFGSAETGSVRIRSQGESRLRRNISMTALDRAAANGVPDQHSPQSMGQRLGRTESSELGQRMWSASTRSNSLLGSPRRTDSTVGPYSTDMTLSELARKPPTGRPGQARPHHGMLTTVSSEHSLTPSSTKEAAHLFATGKLNSLSIRTHAQESSGDSQTLDSYFKAQSIGAHRPPHIPALRMLPNVASAEAAGLLGTAGQAGRAALGLKAGVGQDLRSQLRASFKKMEEQPSGQSSEQQSCATDDMTQPSASPRILDGRRDAVLQPQSCAATNATRMDLHRVRSRSAEFLRDKGPMAMRAPSPGAEGKELAELSKLVSSNEDTTTGLRAPASGCAEQLDAKQPSQEKQSRSADIFCDNTPLAEQNPGPGAESKEPEDDASRQPISAAAFRANAASSLMMGAMGTPRRASRLTGTAAELGPAPSSSIIAALGDEEHLSGSTQQPPSSTTAAVGEMREPMSSSAEAATGFRAPASGDAEQRPSESQEAGHGSFRWRSIRGSIRGSFLEAGSHFKKRRWSLLLMGNKGQDRRFSMPTRRVQKRLSNDIALRDRRWASIFGKALPAQRQDPFSVASRLDAASKPSHVSHSAHSKPPIMAQQLRHTHILSLKVAVGCGSVCTFHVGGAPDGETSAICRWEFFIGDRPHCTSVSIDDLAAARQPMEQISSIEHFLDPGEVAVSTEVAQQVKGLWDLWPLPWSGFKMQPLQSPPEPGGDVIHHPGQPLHKGISQAVVDRAEAVLRAHLPDAVSKRIEAGLKDYINELRVCTVLFIGFPSLKVANPASNGSAEVTSIQAATMMVQKCMQQHSGSFLQFRCDEKGFVSICAFGLPGKTHEDDPSRGVRAALHLIESLQDGAVVGVTTGQLLCACVGSATRSEYTVYGNAINLSARLMSKATAGGGRVLCDSTTYLLAPKAASFKSLQLLEIKGRRQPVSVYEAFTPATAEPLSEVSLRRARVLAEDSSDTDSIMHHDHSMPGLPPYAQTPLIGADYILTQVNDRVDVLVGSRKGGCILVEGEAGMGKSRLLEEIQHSSLGGKEEAVYRVRASASTAHRSQALYPWRRVFKALFAHDHFHGQEHTTLEQFSRGQLRAATKLGIRLHECGCEWQEWHKSLSVLLEVLEDEMPVLPQNSRSYTGEALPGDKKKFDKQVSMEGLAIQLGYTSKSMPTMLPQTAKTITLAAPSVGSPFAAYAKAIPDDAMTLEHLKSTGDTTLRKSLSEGEAGEIQKSLFRFMHPETSGEPRNHTAGASTSPLSLLRGPSTKLSRRPDTQSRQYALSHQSSQHYSLASLASSMRSEERLRQSSANQILSPTMPSQHRLDSQPFGSFGQRAVLRQNSTDSRLSAASSTVNFLHHHDDSVSRRSQSFSGLVSDGRAGMGSLGSPREPQWSGREGIMRSFLDSQPNQAATGSAFPPKSQEPSPHVSPAMSSSSHSGAPTTPSRTSSNGHHAPFVPMYRAQTAPFTEQADRSSINTASQETPAAPQRRRGTRQLSHETLQAASPFGWHSVQPLIPIRSGEVELFVRHQQLRNPGSYPEPVPEQASSTASSLSTAREGSGEVRVSDDSSNHTDRTTSATCPVSRRRQGMGTLFASAKPRILAKPPEALQAKREASAPALTLSSAMPHHSAPPATPKWAQQGIGLADLDMACDAAIATVQASGTELATAGSMAGTSLPKAAKRSNTQGWFTRRRSLSLDGGSSADVTPAALGMQGRPETAPTRLADAESMLPKAALQNLRDDALARLAASKARQDGNASTTPKRHAAASVPLRGLQAKDWDPSQLQKLRTKSSSMGPASKMPMQDRLSQDAAWAGRLRMAPEAKALKLQELLLTVLREWTQVYGPLLVLLDDFDRADVLSWLLLARVAEQPGLAVLVVTAMRPDDGIFATPGIGQAAKTAVHCKVTALHEGIRERPCTLRLLMQPFTPEQTQTFLRAALDGVHISAEVALHLWEKTGGLPLYMEQMVVYMQQQQHGSSGADAQDGLSAFIHSTVTVHSLITDRIDKLQPGEQLTLKIASVMGMSVSAHLLNAAYPIAISADALERDLLELEKANFLRSTDVPGTWLMTQVLARDVAYELIPFSQRRSLHAKLAQALENDASADLVPPSTVAYHWTHSCAGAEAMHWRRALHAVDWWEKAAQIAVDEGIDPAEAIGLFQRSENIAGILKSAFRLAADLTPQGQSETSKTSKMSKPSFWAARRSTPSALSARSAHSSSSGHAHANLNLRSRVVHPVRRAHWQRCMASLQLVQGDLDSARRHGLRALHFLGAPLPSGEPEQAPFLACGFSLVRLSCMGCPGQRVSDDGSSTSEGSNFVDMATWIADSLQWPGQEADGEKQPASEIDWERMRLQVAAAVLELLMRASLMLQPIDEDALKYVCTTARLLQGLRWGRHFPKDSLLLPVVQKCRAALVR